MPSTKLSGRSWNPTGSWSTPKLPAAPPSFTTPGTLYIQSTGLLPQYRGQGLGHRIKAWQIEYAKQNAFRPIVTNYRETNSPMISINNKFGFQPIRTTPAYYEDGEATVVMELLLG